VLVSTNCVVFTYLRNGAIVISDKTNTFVTSFASFIFPPNQKSLKMFRARVFPKGVYSIRFRLHSSRLTVVIIFLTNPSNYLIKQNKRIKSHSHQLIRPKCDHANARTTQLQTKISQFRLSSSKFLYWVADSCGGFFKKRCCL
jgi:hypothetical protein